MTSRDLDPPVGSAPSFSHSVSSNGRAVVIELAGEVDFTASTEFRKAVYGLIESSSAPAIVVDLSGVRLVDAAAVRVLVDAHAAAAARGQRLYVDGLRLLPARVFEVLGLGWLRLPPTGVPSLSNGRVNGHDRRG